MQRRGTAKANRATECLVTLAILAFTFAPLASRESIGRHLTERQQTQLNLHIVADSRRLRAASDQAIDLAGSIPEDAWGSPITATIRGKTILVLSPGPDRIAHTNDDVIHAAAWPGL